MLTRVLATKLNDAEITADIMTFNMNKKWNPAWEEELTKDGTATVFKEGALNPFFGLPNPMSSLFRINVLPKLGFMRKFSDYDIVHFIGEADLSFPIFSYFVKKPKLLQCIAIFRNGGIYKYFTSKRAIFGRTFKIVFPHIADKFVVSSWEEKKLLANLGVSKNKIAILPIGVDTEIFHPDTTKKTEAMLLFVGRIYRIKGLHTLLQALPYVKIPVKLVVIGPSCDPEYMKEVDKESQAINSLGFHKVTMMGELNPTDLVSWYQKASLLVCPYVYETFSNVTREALACGTPVISTGSHLVGGHMDGISISSQNPKDLANVINNLLEKPQLCEGLGREGRKIIEQYFSWGSIIEKLSKIYANMVKEYVKS